MESDLFLIEKMDCFILKMLFCACVLPPLFVHFPTRVRATCKYDHTTILLGNENDVVAYLVVSAQLQSTRMFIAIRIPQTTT